jgi:uncharacterized protein YgiM (DUF1202 family)
VRLSKEVPVYIHSKYLEFSRNRTTAIVTGSRVNVRAKSGINFTPLGQVKKGDKVFVVKVSEGWATIKPPATTVGWIKDSFLKFKSKNLSSFEKSMFPKEEPEEVRVPKEMKVPKVSITPKASVIIPQKKEMVVTSNSKVSLPDQQMIFASGFLEKKEKASGEKSEYIFLVDNKPAYILKGVEQMLDEFLYYKVRIEGQVNSKKDVSFNYPVVNVSKIQLIY